MTKAKVKYGCPGCKAQRSLWMLSYKAHWRSCKRCGKHFKIDEAVVIFQPSKRPERQEKPKKPPSRQLMERRIFQMWCRDELKGRIMK